MGIPGASDDRVKATINPEKWSPTSLLPSDPWVKARYAGTFG